MPPLQKLWQSLEEIPGTEAVLAEWRSRLGGDFQSVQSLLRKSDRLAGCYPAGADQTLPYRVVKHGNDDFVGVPTDGGETLCLKREDVVIHLLDRRRLAKEIATAFGFTPEFADFQESPVTWRIGTALAAGGTPVAVHLVLPIESEDLHQAIQAIASQVGVSGIVVAPTRRCLKPRTETLLRLTKGHFIALCDSLHSRDRQGWQTNSAAPTAIAEFLNPGVAVQDEPLGDRAQSVLIAMYELGLFDSDHRRTTEDISAKALGSGADANALKGVMANLKIRQLVISKTGRSGGCWLTESGRIRAEKLRRV
jgi:hypothetical protein